MLPCFAACPKGGKLLRLWRIPVESHVTLFDLSACTWCRWHTSSMEPACKLDSAGSKRYQGLVYLNCAASTKNNPKGDQNGGWPRFRDVEMLRVNENQIGQIGQIEVGSEVVAFEYLWMPLVVCYVCCFASAGGSNSGSMIRLISCRLLFSGCIEILILTLNPWKQQASARFEGAIWNTCDGEGSFNAF